jgi:hypothetical protein
MHQQPIVVLTVLLMTGYPEPCCPWGFWPLRVCPSQVQQIPTDSEQPIQKMGFSNTNQPIRGPHSNHPHCGSLLFARLGTAPTLPLKLLEPANPKLASHRNHYKDSPLYLWLAASASWPNLVLPHAPPTPCLPTQSLLEIHEYNGFNVSWQWLYHTRIIMKLTS